MNNFFEILNKEDININKHYSFNDYDELFVFLNDKENIKLINNANTFENNLINVIINDIDLIMKIYMPKIIIDVRNFALGFFDDLDYIDVISAISTRVNKFLLLINNKNNYDKLISVLLDKGYKKNISDLIKLMLIIDKNDYKKNHLYFIENKLEYPRFKTLCYLWNRYNFLIEDKDDLNIFEEDIRVIGINNIYKNFDEILLSFDSNKNINIDGFSQLSKVKKLFNLFDVKPFDFVMYNINNNQEKIMWKFINNKEIFDYLCDGFLDVSKIDKEFVALNLKEENGYKYLRNIKFFDIFLKLYDYNISSINFNMQELLVMLPLISLCSNSSTIKINNLDIKDYKNIMLNVEHIYLYDKKLSVIEMVEDIINLISNVDFDNKNKFIDNLNCVYELEIRQILRTYIENFNIYNFEKIVLSGFVN